MAPHRTILIGVLAALAATPAAAQVRTPAGILFPEVSVMSESRFAGISNSDRKPTVRAGAYLWRPDGLYAGGELTRVRYNEGRGIDAELVLYGGRNLERGKTRLTLEGMAVLYDQRCCGPSFDFVQVTGKARRAFGPLSLGAEATYTPDAAYEAGPAWRLTGDAAWRLSDWATVGGRIGAYDSLRRQDRTYWDLGVTFKHGRVSADVRWSDTDLSRAECFYTDWCEGALVTRLTYALPAFKP